MPRRADPLGGGLADSFSQAVPFSQLGAIALGPTPDTVRVRELLTYDGAATTASASWTCTQQGTASSRLAATTASRGQFAASPRNAESLRCSSGCSASQAASSGGPIGANTWYTNASMRFASRSARTKGM